MQKNDERKASVVLKIFRHRRFRWTVRLSALAVILLGIAAVLFPQEVLTIESGPVQADVIVLLGGAPHDRVSRAAELFKQGAAPKIICSGTGDDRLNWKMLLQAGVPAEAIQLESNSWTTRENARDTIPLLHAMGAKRVIIVTSWFHSRRALHTFQHYAPDITFYSRPSYYGYPGGGAKQKAESGKQPGDESREKREDGRSGKAAPLSTLPSSLSESSASNVSFSASQRLSVSHDSLSTLPSSPSGYSSSFSPAAWRDVKGYVKSEYVKLIGYWVYYGVWPF